MIKIWSELRVARVKEQVADLATLVWVVFWGNVAWRLFQFLASYTEAGRTIRNGGETMAQSGRDLGDSLARIHRPSSSDGSMRARGADRPGLGS